MSKQHNITWTENNLNELRRSVKNFNAKVKRLEDKYNGLDVVLPERMSVKELRKIVTTERDLQRELKSLQNFTQRGSEELIVAKTDTNISITKWQNEELKKRAKIINKMRDIKKEEYLNRDVIEPDVDNIKNFIENKVVLVTGAAGSIGSEIVRQLAKYKQPHLTQVTSQVWHTCFLAVLLFQEWICG